MYSLLNYIAATSKDTYDTTLLTTSSLAVAADQQTIHSTDAGLRGLTDDEKRLVGISTISVVTRLALEFDSEEVLVLLHIPRDEADHRSGHEIDYLNVVATTAHR